MTSADDLTDDERRALDALVPRDQQTGDLATDLAAAAQESMRRRVENSIAGGHAINALYRTLGSWRRLQAATGIPVRTARRWAKLPARSE
jgi:hypothetical protein